MIAAGPVRLSRERSVGRRGRPLRCPVVFSTMVRTDSRLGRSRPWVSRCMNRSLPGSRCGAIRAKARLAPRGLQLGSRSASRSPCSMAAPYRPRCRGHPLRHTAGCSSVLRHSALFRVVGGGECLVAEDEVAGDGGVQVLRRTCRGLLRAAGLAASSTAPAAGAVGRASRTRRPRRWATLPCVLLTEKQDPRRLPLRPRGRGNLSRRRRIAAPCPHAPVPGHRRRRQ